MRTSEYTRGKKVERLSDMPEGGMRYLRAGDSVEVIFGTLGYRFEASGVFVEDPCKGKHHPQAYRVLITDVLRVDSEPLTPQHPTQINAGEIFDLPAEALWR